VTVDIQLPDHLTLQETDIFQKIGSSTEIGSVLNLHLSKILLSPKDDRMTNSNDTQHRAIL